MLQRPQNPALPDGAIGQLDNAGLLLDKPKRLSPPPPKAVDRHLIQGPGACELDPRRQASYDGLIG